MRAEPTTRVLSVDAAALIDLTAGATRAGASVWVHVRGSSMTPAIPQGADVHLAPPPRRGARRGDVVLVRTPAGQPILHRVWLRLGDRLWLKGDARALPDAPVRDADVIGLATRLRHGGVERLIPPLARVRPRQLAGRWRAVARDVLGRG